MAEEVMPKNIIMIGPTGVGKTEIARRLAKLANSPFLKVEASKFTEVGYVGRDVESMIRDLVEISIDMVRNEKVEEVADKAERMPKSGFSICFCLRKVQLTSIDQIEDDRSQRPQEQWNREHAKNCVLSFAKASWTTGSSKSR